MKAAIREIVKSSNGRFMTVTFTKKDGSTRVLNGRTGVTSKLAGGVRTTSPEKYFILYENNNGYRAINYDAVSEIKVDGNIINFSKAAKKINFSKGAK